VGLLRRLNADCTFALKEEDRVKSLKPRVELDLTDDRYLMDLPPPMESDVKRTDDCEKD
jgi:hypothetical protein